MTAGHSYTVTKYVAIETASTSAGAAAAARRQAASAASAGFTTTLAENTAAWQALWAGRIDVLGNPVLATEVNASEFYLWASTRDGGDWSISPAGLSSNAYNGHIFWDAETWMYPSLLAQHPDLAAGIDMYRYHRLGAAEAHAAATGYAGARFPWESALDGTEQVPPPAPSTLRACMSSTSPPTSRSLSGSTTWPPATAPGWPPTAGRCSRRPRRSGPAG